MVELGAACTLLLLRPEVHLRLSPLDPAAATLLGSKAQKPSSSLVVGPPSRRCG